MPVSNLKKVVPGGTTVAAGAGARPMLARVVGGPGAGNQQQQVITLENLLSLANPQQKTAGGAVSKGGVVQFPLSALSGLNVAGAASSSTANQPTTVLLQNVKGSQSILLPAGFQGGTINIRGVRLATVAGQPANAPSKQAFVARLVTPSATVHSQTNPQPKNADL